MNHRLNASLGLGIACCLFTAPVVGAAQSSAAAPTIVRADQAKYGSPPAPYPAGATMAVLSGDPSKAGSEYAVRLKLVNGTKIGVHTHGDTENVTVISGTLLVGVGTAFDAAKMLALKPGDYVSIPSGTPHFAMARGLTVVQVNGVGPASMTLLK